MSKSTGNMYTFLGETFNPLNGECTHKCTYCSSKSFMRYPEFNKCYSGELRLNDNAMKKNFKDKSIFVVAQNDLFAENVPDKIIVDILNKCHDFKNCKLYFQTKNPKKLLAWKTFIPVNSVIITTIENECNYLSKAPTCMERSVAMEQIKGFEKQVTIEPIVKFHLRSFLRLFKITGATKFNIGADSKKHNLEEPTKEEVLELILELEKVGEVYQKSNLSRIIK